MESIRLNKLHKALLLLLENSQGHVSRTKLVKLLFLADLKSYSQLGSSISGITYQRYFYGPYSDKIIEAINATKDYEIDEQEGISSSGRKYFSYRRGSVDRADLSKIKFSGDPAVEDKMMEILSDIGKKYGKLSTDEILKKVYSLPQFEKTEFGQPIKL